MQHTVNKLSFSFTCSKEEQAYVLRKNFIEGNYADIVSIINAECDHLSNMDEFVEINKVEVHLSLGEEVIYNPQKYLDALRLELRNQLGNTKHSPVEKKSLKQNRLRILTFFLQHGYLPWWATREEFDVASICNDINTSQQFTGIIDFLLLHKEEAHIWERLSFQFADDFKRSIISEIGILKEVRETLKKLVQQHVANKKIFQQSIKEYEQELNHFMLKNGAQIFTKIGSNTNIASPDEINLLLDNFLQIIEPVYQKKETFHTDSYAKTDKSNFPTNGIQSMNEMQESDQPKEKILVLNSGIILLNVFLPSLFKNLEYWKNEQWISTESQTRAVHLMHYLATSGENPFEHELVLEKVLCGISVSQPVDRWIRLTNREKQEADDLLASMIDHWKALKNTSVSGLRSSFFQREGLLSFNKNSCLLQIERKTVDVLLEMLPWGYATVSLPWNPYLIYTEW